MADTAPMLRATCHCGRVTIDVAGPPAFVVECNCSICRRNGARWAFYPPADLVIAGHPGETAEYVWGAKSLRTLHCRTCGCTTHWEPLAESADARFGVNTRLLDPAILENVRVRHFDGADTWQYLD